MAAQDPSNAQWAERIDNLVKDLIVPENKFHKYHLPAIGSMEFAQTIDHTLLKLDATSDQIDQICTEAKEHEFASVCVRVNFVKQCIEALKGSNVKVACVIGFHDPSATSTQDKVEESKAAVNAGAQELDLVIKYPELIQKDYTTVFSELQAIREAAPAPTLIKLILETSQLSQEQIVAGCVLASAAGLDFVKTSTGFNGAGANVQNVRLMKSACVELGAEGGRKGQMKVKASGGVRTLTEAVNVMEAGAERLGVSAGVAIAKEGKAVKEGGKAATGTAAAGGADGY